VQLQLHAIFKDDGNYALDAFALDDDGLVVASTGTTVPPLRLQGSLALVSNAGQNATAHWFDDWQGFGAKLRSLPNRAFGPVLFSSYTLSQGVLTMNAQYPPVCAEAFSTPILQVGVDGHWVDVAQAAIDPQSHTARFRVDDWDDSRPHQYRILTAYRTDNEGKNAVFDGIVQTDPISRDELIIAIYNCRPGIILSETEGWIQQNNGKPFTWTRERVVFPHEELLDNSSSHEPDLLAFLGDQLYEFDPNGFIDHSPANIIDDYLWKWFQFGWSVRDLMRNTPAFIIPDDHDVYQGNVWGQQGIAALDANDGGYVHAADFIGVVQRTQTGSLPPAYDPTPVAQGIGVYYTNLVYGGIGMAVLEDRKFKTGANSSQTPRHLLGERQHVFLDDWARNWQGQQMKLAFSQSPFSQSTTHSGASFKRILTDRDSNGWPREGRDRAVRALQRVGAPHIAGDQHLGMLLRHGVDAADDAVFSFAGPSMLNIFPRIWDPLNDSDGPGVTGSPYTGTYTDAHGNLITVIAAANPAVYYRPVDMQTHARKDDLGIGYGIVTIDKSDHSFTFAAWPANRDPALQAQPYEGWPVTVSQADNDGRIPTGYLPPRQASVPQPLVVVEDERDDTLVYARRSATPGVSLPVYDSTTSYRVTLSDPEGAYRQQWVNQVPGR
jgi:hypothetical protein